LFLMVVHVMNAAVRSSCARCCQHVDRSEWPQGIPVKGRSGVASCRNLSH
jgi:hypothetical protein